MWFCLFGEAFDARELFESLDFAAFLPVDTSLLSMAAV